MFTYRMLCRFIVSAFPTVSRRFEACFWAFVGSFVIVVGCVLEVWEECRFGVMQVNEWS